MTTWQRELLHLFGFSQLILQGFDPTLQAADHLASIFNPTSPLEMVCQDDIFCFEDEDEQEIWLKSRDFATSNTAGDCFNISFLTGLGVQCNVKVEKN